MSKKQGDMDMAGDDIDMEEDDSNYDYLVEAAYEALEESGFKSILVSGYEDMPEPAAIPGTEHVPDIEAVNNTGKKFYFEICPPEVFAVAELEDRLNALIDYAATIDAQVVLIVAEGDAEIANAFLAEHEIQEENIAVWEA